MKGVDGVCKRVNIIRLTEFMMNKEWGKDEEGKGSEKVGAVDGFQVPTESKDCYRWAIRREWKAKLY